MPYAPGLTASTRLPMSLGGQPADVVFSTNEYIPRREMEMERLRLRDEVENLQMQLASLEGETPRAVKDDTLRRVRPIP